MQRLHRELVEEPDPKFLPVRIHHGARSSSVPGVSMVTIGRSGCIPDSSGATKFTRFRESREHLPGFREKCHATTASDV